MAAFASGLRVCILALLVAGILFAAGFVFFINTVEGYRKTELIDADGVVALTGGEDRIDEAVKLLAEGHAGRLLITGVHPTTTSRQLGALVPEGRELFDCCIDLGRKAQDTTGNASETRNWVQLHKFKSIIVVTSSYHMPRTLAELRREMPGVTIVPHAVVPGGFQSSRWWADRKVLRVAVFEYVKYLAALSRLVSARAAGASGARQSTVSVN